MLTELPELAPPVLPPESFKARFLRIVNAPWFSYVSLLAMQAVFAWRFWWYRDITVGDTSSYFTEGYRWFSHFKVNIAWSPLYTAFYGTMLFFTRDAAIATLMHRAIIVFAATFMVLALTRRLFPAWIAWSLALWWACLPINFETLYEVHLFALLPILVGALIVAHRNTAFYRGMGLAVLVLTMVLVRNETMIGVACFGLVCLIYEISRVRKTDQKIWKGLLKISPAYVVPILVAYAIILGAYHISHIQSDELPAVLHSKHTLNMAQVYSFGYGQRHPEYKGDAWIGYAPLMTETFGKDLPTIWEMIHANPRAVAEHFWWNISLTPSGLQLMLFNKASGKVNPDYADTHLHSKAARQLSWVMLIVIAIGGLLSLIQRKYWWRTAMRSQIFIWLFMFSVAMATFAIVPTQRPRPSYLFALSVTLMAIVGASALVIVANLRLPEWSRAWMLPIAIVICTTVAIAGRPTAVAHAQPYTQAHRHLAPYEKAIADPRTVALGFCAGDCWRYASGTNVNLISPELFIHRDPAKSLDEWLEESHITMVYLDEGTIDRLTAENSPLVMPVLKGDPSTHWRVLSRSAGTEDDWLLLQHVAKVVTGR